MKSSRTDSPPRVALLVETTRSYTRDLLAGISHFIDSHGPWSTFLELRAFESSLPPWLMNWDGDGIITRTHSAEIAEAIAATDYQQSSTLHQLRNGISFRWNDNALIGQRRGAFCQSWLRRFAAYTLDTESFFENESVLVLPLRQLGPRKPFRHTVSPARPTGGAPTGADGLAYLTGETRRYFCRNDQLGVRLIDACQRAGIAVPEEVAVVGCENEETLCEFTSPSLTSVRFDGHTVGFRAATLLDRLMKNKVVDPPSLIPPRGIEVRESSDEFVIEDAVALRAVRMIREKAFQGLTVAAICEQLSISRSTLERRMKAALKRGPKEEILRIQFREVKRLLRNTSLTIEVIAEQVGFSHAHYLRPSFGSDMASLPASFENNSRASPFTTITGGPRASKQGIIQLGLVLNETYRCDPDFPPHSEFHLR